MTVNKPTRILAIETSCDETALALVECSGGIAAPRCRVVRNIVASQIDIHRPWGGVVPLLAKREHIKNLPLVYQKLAGMPAPDLIGVTVGPGLEPALWAGIEFAKELRHTAFPNVPLIGVNHLEGHLYSFLLAKKTGIANYQLPISDIFPAIALIVSGGHTILLRVASLGSWKKLGETRDDAVGEAFDKVAKMLGLPYPGGPEIEKLARHGNPAAIPFPRPMLHSKDYDFSFSGLKTSVLYYLRDHTSEWKRHIPDIAASFQAAATEVLVAKTARAVTQYGARSILLSGGVATNASIRAALSREAKRLNVPFIVPPLAFNTDNATMIAVATYLTRARKKRYPLRANGTLSI